MSGVAAKLKASCDRCASDKVKCGKQHPSCARCEQANRECVYGVSQRAGKPSKAKLALRRELAACGVPLISASAVSSSTAGSPPPPPSNVTRDSNSEPPNATREFWLSMDMMLPTLSWQDDIMDASEMPSAANHSPTAYHDQCAALPGLLPSTSFSGSTTHYSMAPSQTISAAAATTTTTTTTPPGTYISGDFSISEIMTPKSTGRSSASLDALGSCCEPGEVARQLCGIFELGQAHSMTLDMLLHEVVALSQKINKHLRCSCAKDCSVLMMLAASECEILDLYQAIANVKPCTPRSGRRGVRQLSLCHSELSLGSFKLDEKMGSAVRDQLVMSQLHDMMEKWELYIDSLSYDRTNAPTDDTKLPFVVTNLVLSRLRSTVREIESRLKWSSSRGA